LPNSADFYSGGRAIGMQDAESRSELEARLNDASEDYYAIEKGDLKDFNSVAEDRTEKIGKRGEFTLFREIKTRRTRQQGALEAQHAPHNHLAQLPSHERHPRH
jgi:hypothetical protein